jgi:DNA-directed RNA polymerase subunit RPC12/RpoP
VFICSNCGIYLDIARMDEGHEDDDYEPRVCPECGLPVETQTYSNKRARLVGRCRDER